MGPFSARGTTAEIGTFLPTNTITLTTSPRDATNINIGDYLTLDYGDTRGLSTHQVTSINGVTGTRPFSLQYTLNEVELIRGTTHRNTSSSSARPNPRTSSPRYAAEVEEVRRNIVLHQDEIRTEARRNNLLQQLLRRTNEH